MLGVGGLIVAGVDSLAHVCSVCRPYTEFPWEQFSRTALAVLFLPYWISFLPFWLLASIAVGADLVFGGYLSNSSRRAYLVASVTFLLVIGSCILSTRMLCAHGVPGSDMCPAVMQPWDSGIARQHEGSLLLGY
jgi:hypothetical protein